MRSLRAHLPELEKLESLVSGWRSARTQVIGHTEYRGETLPIYSIGFGPEDRSKPTLLFVGGVHGLERIGTQILLAQLNTYKASQSWDELHRRILERVRVFFIPIINPVGMSLRTRANGAGVDLMRNAPTNAAEPGRWYQLYRGHRLSSRLPWYRGKLDEAMQPEAEALWSFVRREVFPSNVSITLDVHSGFTGKDRLWFPYARTRELFPRAPEMFAFEQLLRETHPNHLYVVEPQSVNYTTHGDLWDYIFDQHSALEKGKLLLPLTLELSAASWYRKNPRQLTSRTGFFHPVKEHRLTRVLRRHRALFDFLLRAAYSHERWLPQNDDHRASLQREAELLWGDPVSN